MSLKEKKKDLGVLVGKRLLATREACKYSLKDAALATNVRVSQLTLFESGKLPTIPALIELAKLYAVPIDFLLCNSDDPIAEPEELKTGAFLHSISDALATSVDSMKNVFTQYVMRAILGMRHDRTELDEICALAICVKDYQERVKQLNPEYEDDIRGAANLDNAIINLCRATNNSQKRMSIEKFEKINFETIPCTESLYKQVYTQAESKFKLMLESN